LTFLRKQDVEVLDFDGMEVINYEIFPLGVKLDEAIPMRVTSSELKTMQDVALLGPKTREVNPLQCEFNLEKLRALLWG
jgi:hypothetical protein